MTCLKIKMKQYLFMYFLLCNTSKCQSYVLSISTAQILGKKTSIVISDTLSTITKHLLPKKKLNAYACSILYKNQDKKAMTLSFTYTEI